MAKTGVKRKDLTDQKFGRLTVIEFSHSDSYRRAYWLCECECGEKVKVRAESLKSGHTTSCGCYHREYKRASHKHGMWKTPEYTTWLNMNQRCYNPNNPIYHNYGGRGIKVCDRWRGEHGFENFFQDMGFKPSDNFTIERKDNNGDYEPGNCKWATYTEQNRNFRRNHLITFDGKTQSIAAWSEEINLPYNIIAYRIRSNWTIERALTESLNIEKSHGK